MENCYTCTRRDQFGGVGFCSAASAIADGGEKQVRIPCLGVEIGTRLDFLCSMIELRLCNILLSIKGGKSPEPVLSRFILTKGSYLDVANVSRS